MTDRRVSKWREAAHRRQGGLCYWCDEPIQLGLPMGHPKRLSAEHLTRRADGGRNTFTNIVAAHADCNSNRHRRPAKRHDKHGW